MTDEWLLKLIMNWVPVEKEEKADKEGVGMKE
jgi:hypothetical protein